MVKRNALLLCTFIFLGFCAGVSAQHDGNDDPVQGTDWSLTTTSSGR